MQHQRPGARLWRPPWTRPLAIVCGGLAIVGLIGMTRADVTGLLGPPTQTDKFQQWDLVYWMGPEPGMGVDSVWLVLRLAADDRVAEHYVLTD